MLDASEIFRNVPKHKKESLIKLGFYIVTFFYYLYRYVIDLAYHLNTRHPNLTLPDPQIDSGIPSSGLNDVTYPLPFSNAIARNFLIYIFFLFFLSLLCLGVLVVKLRLPVIRMDLCAALTSVLRLLVT